MRVNWRLPMQQQFTATPTGWCTVVQRSTTLLNPIVNKDQQLARVTPSGSSKDAKWDLPSVTIKFQVYFKVIFLN